MPERMLSAAEEAMQAQQARDRASGTRRHTSERDRDRERIANFGFVKTPEEEAFFAQRAEQVAAYSLAYTEGVDNYMNDFGFHDGKTMDDYITCVHPDEAPDMVDTHIKMAYDHAQKQMSIFTNTPARYDGCEAHPCVDPQGCFTETHMGYTERLQQIQLYAKMSAPKNKAFAENLASYLGGPLATDSLNNANMNAYALNAEIKSSMREMRTLERAKDLSLSDGAKAHFDEKIQEIKSSDFVKEFEHALGALEVIVGIKDGPLTPDMQYVLNERVARMYSAKTQAGKPDYEIERYDFDQLAQDASIRHPNPEVLNINYPYLKIRMECAICSDMRHFQMLEQDRLTEVTKDNRSIGEQTVDMEKFLCASADKHFDAAFSHVEKNAGGLDAPSRASLITIEGKSVRSMILDAAEKEGHTTPEAKEAFFDQHNKQLTAQYVSAGVLTGRRVEAFVPNEQGQLPLTPVAVTQNGIDPTSMTPVTLNIVQRALNKMGFYKEKAADAARYKAVMDGRKEVQESYTKETGIQPLVPPSKQEIKAQEKVQKAQEKQQAKKATAPKPRSK